MHLTPNSWGSPLREFNACHEPAGADGGQFCGATRVGITSARTAKDPEHHRSNKVVGEQMRGLERTLQRLPGVRNVSVKPAQGQWAADGSEFSWAVSYVGNGAARKALAAVGKEWNQDSVLILRRPKPGETPDAATEFSLDAPMGLPTRAALAGYMSELGLGGWTWYKRNGRTTLRIASVPQWGGTNEDHATAMSKLATRLRSLGTGFRTRALRVKAEVYEREARDGVPSYDDVLGR